MASPQVPFGALVRQAAALGEELNETLLRVAAGGWYVLGEELRHFEAEFAAYCGTAHCVGVASGFDALYLALVALDIGPGDEVITVANACVYQAAAILQAGARPVFVDVEPQTHNLDPALLEAAITPQTKAILPVHLYGRLADMPAIYSVARAHGLALIEDAAQAHGAWADAAEHPRRAGAWGDVACFSFYPSKNLGALGDAGALTTDDVALAERLRALRMYGWGEKYITSQAGGRNSRLDEIQAAVLRLKLRHLDAWNEARVERAGWYNELLAGLPLTLPADEPGHVYHLFVVSSEQRDSLHQHLRTAGIGCDIHYPLPTHLQPAYQQLGYQPGALPVTERLASQILSLPLYPELSREELELVAEAVRGAFV
ncbi:DegT/DnrJ/EryC1/StrS family aminotransferase [Candidatus Viridilinea mediisalina]|uniref:Erythromycin biosynthesis sensory transduction protein eryC1 n=1 Tax=Candidatus Viridilinea mediisalina TaxID=2024553 RepID=A0A2A6RLM5_9CHLR|nr:DegT/DnrJ/EryC1/StrS family aminotransferase [Candidatus Viridilinea mediisalina]PDW03796.1 erythromycin biosynthesis sensory transduction protein eryC1 [Candidatus Viridilinea mediisalina]